MPTGTPLFLKFVARKRKATGLKAVSCRQFALPTSNTIDGALCFVRHFLALLLAQLIVFDIPANTCILPGVIPEIDIWRAATLMIKRYGDLAQVESANRADELAASGDDAGAAVWRRITHAVSELENTVPPGLPH
jgi:hypothetical protein